MFPAMEAIDLPVGYPNGVAAIFGHFMAVTRVPFEIADWVSHLPLPGYAIMIVIILIYLFGGF